MNIVTNPKTGKYYDSLGNQQNTLWLSNFIKICHLYLKHPQVYHCQWYWHSKINHPKICLGNNNRKKIILLPDPNNITAININKVFLLTIWKNMYIKPRTVATNNPIKPMIVIACTALNQPENQKKKIINTCRSNLPKHKSGECMMRSRAVPI